MLAQRIQCVGSPIITNGLIRRYFCGRADAVDVISGNNGVLRGAPAFIGGSRSPQIQLNATTKWVDGFGSPLAPVGTKSIVARLTPISTAVRFGICGTRPAGTTSAGFALCANRTTAGNLSYLHPTGSLIEAAAGLTAGVAVWIGVSLNAASATAKLWSGGAVIKTIASFSAENSSSYYGVIGDEDGALSSKMNGYLEDFRIYNRALSDNEMLAIAKGAG